MKRLRLLAFLIQALLGALPAPAAIPVIDVTQISQQAQAHVEDLLQYAEMIERALQQIALLTDQLVRQDFIAQVLGNPATNTTLVGLAVTQEDLRRPGTNHARAELAVRLNVRETQRYDGGGLFHAVGEVFRTLEGQAVPRAEAPYKPEAALVAAVANFDRVHTEVMARRRALREALAHTLEQLRLAPTQAEAQKLIGVVLGQFANLEATDRELLFAAQQAVLQDLENRNDLARQDKAAQEELAVEFSQAMDKARTLFRPDPTPTRVGSR
jgi:hypothetical protein